MCGKSLTETRDLAVVLEVLVGLEGPAVCGPIVEETHAVEEGEVAGTHTLLVLVAFSQTTVLTDVIVEEGSTRHVLVHKVERIICKNSC